MDLLILLPNFILLHMSGPSMKWPSLLGYILILVYQLHYVVGPSYVVKDRCYQDAFSVCSISPFSLPLSSHHFALLRRCQDQNVQSNFAKWREQKNWPSALLQHFSFFFVSRLIICRSGGNNPLAFKFNMATLDYTYRYCSDFRA